MRDLLQSPVVPSAAVAELEKLISQHIMPSFTEYRKAMSDEYPTFKFWDMFLDAAELFLHHVRADREGNWKLHLHSRSSMLPYYGFGNKVTYTKWSPTYILNMLQLSKSAKYAFERGNFQ